MGCCGGGKRANRGRARRLKPKTAKEVKAQMVKIEPRAQILMCRPKFFGINYSINPWMNVNHGIDHNKAVDQWNILKSKLRELGARIQCVPPREDLPDMVFTANAGYVMKGNPFNIILASFLFKERQGEEKYFQEWFEGNGYSVSSFDRPFEGAGDALYLGDDLIFGYGFRSDPLNHPEFYNRGEHSVHLVHLVDPYFYHLDTCFCPLQDKDYLVWPGAFESVDPIRKLGGKEIAVTEEDAKKFACNAVCIGKDVVLPAGCSDTMQKLEQAGYTPHEVEMSEYMLSGGACKCLTLTL